MASTDTDIDSYGPVTASVSPDTPLRGPASSCPPVTVLDPEGDVILVVPSEEGIARFQINSHILCVASPVFRAMLGKHSRFKEASALAAARLRSDSDTTSSPARPYEVNLADDNPKALAVVLRILHMKTALVPKSATECQLYEVAIICDKYDLAAAVTFWAEQWIALLAPEESPTPPTVFGHQWLFIAYVFGRVTLFKALTREVILSSTLDESGALLMPAPAGLGSNEYLPDSIISKFFNITSIILYLIVTNIR